VSPSAEYSRNNSRMAIVPVAGSIANWLFLRWPDQYHLPYNNGGMGLAGVIECLLSNIVKIQVCFWFQYCRNMCFKCVNRITIYTLWWKWVTVVNHCLTKKNLLHIQPECIEWVNVLRWIKNWICWGKQWPKYWWVWCSTFCLFTCWNYDH